SAQKSGSGRYRHTAKYIYGITQEHRVYWFGVIFLRGILETVILQSQGGNVNLIGSFGAEKSKDGNTFPVVSQIASAGYAIGGNMDEAKDLQEEFARNMARIVDSIPVAGHIKGGVHYALGENEQGEEAMKAASRSTGVIIGGVGGFVAGGPVGAVAGGIAGGAAADGIITGSDILAKGDKAKAYGYVKDGEVIADAIKGKKSITTEEGVDMALGPISDGFGGYAGGKFMGKPFAGSKVVPNAIGKGTIYKVLDDAGGAAKSGAGRGGIDAVLDNSIVKIKPGAGAKVSGDVNLNRFGFDKAALDNRANQLNPNHQASGPGRPSGYRGAGTMEDLNNHANQLNPNNLAYHASRGASDINSRNV
ncbi:unnamed protein product, partial [Allacma fusca]